MHPINAQPITIPFVQNVVTTLTSFNAFPSITTITESTVNDAISVLRNPKACILGDARRDLLPSLQLFHRGIGANNFEISDEVQTVYDNIISSGLRVRHPTVRPYLNAIADCVERMIKSGLETFDNSSEEVNATLPPGPELRRYVQKELQGILNHPRLGKSLAYTEPQSTIDRDGSLVPWLSADLSEHTPITDDTMDYAKIMGPALIDKERGECLLGDSAGHRPSIETIINFLHGYYDNVCVYKGLIRNNIFHSPIAIFTVMNGSKYILAQGGSYLLVNKYDQPNLRDGEVILTRGVHYETEFKYYSFNELSEETMYHYARLQMLSFLDSRIAFVFAHHMIRKVAANHINSVIPLLFEDLIENDNSLQKLAYKLFGILQGEFHFQSFSLSRKLAANKFGPNFVCLKTPVDNIRITSTFTSEDEVFIINPDRVEFIQNESNIPIEIKAVSELSS